MYIISVRDFCCFISSAAFWRWNCRGCAHISSAAISKLSNSCPLNVCRGHHVSGACNTGTKCEGWGPAAVSTAPWNANSQSPDGCSADVVKGCCYIAPHWLMNKSFILCTKHKAMHSLSLNVLLPLACQLHYVICLHLLPIFTVLWFFWGPLCDWPLFELLAQSHFMAIVQLTCA